MKKLLVAILCVFLNACDRGEADLGSGYRFFGVDGQNAAIVDQNNRMVVDPNVLRYKVIGSYIVGERVDANIDNRLSKRYGFFILDMRNGKLAEGLTKSELESALRARHIDATPF